jgi:hypothetical protein
MGMGRIQRGRRSGEGRGDGFGVGKGRSDGLKRKAVRGRQRIWLWCGKTSDVCTWLAHGCG